MMCVPERLTVFPVAPLKTHRDGTGRLLSSQYCDPSVLLARRKQFRRRSAAAPAIQIIDPPRSVNERQASVSYAWREELSHDPTRAGKVEDFRQRPEGAGHKLLRDTTNLPLHGRIGGFMRQSIGRADRVHDFLSDAYLRSPNCMCELREIWRSSGSDSAAFSSTVPYWRFMV